RPRVEAGDVEREVVRRRLARDERRRCADVLGVPRRQCLGVGCGEPGLDDPHRAMLAAVSRRAPCAASVARSMLLPWIQSRSSRDPRSRRRSSPSTISSRRFVSSDARWTVAMGKRKKIWASKEERDAWEAHVDETLRRLRAAIESIRERDKRAREAGG